MFSLIRLLLLFLLIPILSFQRSFYLLIVMLARAQSPSIYTEKYRDIPCISEYKIIWSFLTHFPMTLTNESFMLWIGFGFIRQSSVDFWALKHYDHFFTKNCFIGFWKHITREEYGTFRLTASDLPSDITGNFKLVSFWILL